MADVQLRGSKRRNSAKPSQVTSYDVKCVVLGDGSVGKSAMLVTYLLGHYPSDCPPGPIDGHSEYDHVSTHPSKLRVGDLEVNLTLVDSYGLDEYEKLRERLCASGDVYMLCFDTSKPSTFERIRDHWIPEMRRYSSPTTPFIVVGLKTDLRTKAQANGSEDMSKFIIYSQGMREASDLGATFYTECSAKNKLNVSRVLGKAAQAAIQNSLSPEMKRTSCAIS